MIFVCTFQYSFLPENDLWELYSVSDWSLITQGYNQRIVHPSAKLNKGRHKPANYILTQVWTAIVFHFIRDAVVIKRNWCIQRLWVSDSGLLDKYSVLMQMLQLDWLSCYTLAAIVCSDLSLSQNGDIFSPLWSFGGRSRHSMSHNFKSMELLNKLMSPWHRYHMCKFQKLIQPLCNFT